MPFTNKKKDEDDRFRRNPARSEGDGLFGSTERNELFSGLCERSEADAQKIDVIFVVGVE